MCSVQCAMCSSPDATRLLLNTSISPLINRKSNLEYVEFYGVALYAYVHSTSLCLEQAQSKNFDG